LVSVPPKTFCIVSPAFFAMSVKFTIGPLAVFCVGTAAAAGKNVIRAEVHSPAAISPHVNATLNVAARRLPHRLRNAKIPGESVRGLRIVSTRDLSPTAQFFSGIRPLRN
jgi:hypothetical protein